MNKNVMTTAIGMVDDDIIAESISARVVRRNSIWQRIGIVAACVVSVLGIGGVSTYAYYTPTSYVSLDVNPSIEYSLNTFDRVLSVKGVNDDGKNILDDIGLVRLKNKAIDRAVRETINAIAKQGYFPEDTEGGVIIAVSDKQAEKAEKLSEKLKEAVNQAAEEEKLVVVVESIAVGEARVQEARDLGVTPGKLNLVEKLKESAENADDIDIEEWLKKSVKDIMKETKANEVLSKGEESTDSSSKNKKADEILDSGIPSNAGKGNDAKKSDKTNNTNSSNNANKNKFESTPEKDNGSNKTDTSDDQSDLSEPNNSGNAKKLYNETALGDDVSSSETSEASSAKGNSTGKSNSSGKNKGSKK